MLTFDNDAEGMAAWVTVVEIGTVTVGLVLIFAAIQKARYPQQFAATLEGVGFAGPVALPASVAFVVAELVTGVLLVAGSPRIVCAGLGLAVTGSFVAVSIRALARGGDVPCSCFGRSERSLGRDTLPLSLLMFSSQLAFVVTLAFGGETNVVESRSWLLAAGFGVIGISRALSIAPTAQALRRDRRLIDYLAREDGLGT